MRYAKAILIMVATFAWMFSIAHCHLEAAGLIALDNCNTENAIPINADPCDNGCKVMEKAPVKAESSKIKVSHVFLALAARLLPIDPVASDQVSSTISSPSRVLPLSLFVARTSCPARAPSFHA
ncbi:MAG: hypothetical protein ACO1QB_04435 [Verrucomicrobiales bacterium]